MSRFLVEVSQESSALTSKRITDSIRSMGSHFATHASWKQNKGTCTGTMIVETENKQQAISIVPPSLRSDAHVFRLE